MNKVIFRFGSSGKRPIDEKECYKISNRILEERIPKPITCGDITDIIKAICKEFSTAEVSEESELEKELKEHYRIYGYEKQHYLKEILEKHMGCQFDVN